MADFDLRPMEPADGPAIDVLMQSEALTTSMALTTHYRHDVYEALVAQYPTLFGVVATSPTSDGLVGMATAYLDEVTVNGEVRPSANLANLKVRSDARRQGLGSRLVAWRIDEARRQFGDDGIMASGVEASNTASLATARRWSTQQLGPVRVVIGRALRTLRRRPGLEVRPMTGADVEAVVAGVNHYLEGHQLYPRQTAATLTAYLAPTSIGVIRQYRVVVDAAGTILAGTAVTERFKVMEDHIERVPRPLELLARVVPVIPPGGVLKTAELSLLWHAPGRLDAGRLLWDAIRYEWRDQATHFAGEADPRSGLFDVLRVGPTLVPRVNIMIPIQSQIRLDEDRPVYSWR